MLESLALCGSAAWMDLGYSVRRLLLLPWRGSQLLDGSNLCTVRLLGSSMLRYYTCSLGPIRSSGLLGFLVSFIHSYVVS